MSMYATSGCKSVNADSLKEAGRIFAERMARREFGKRGDARICTLNSWSRDMSLGEFTAFIGITKGHETNGRNINFTVCSV